MTFKGRLLRRYKINKKNEDYSSSRNDVLRRYGINQKDEHYPSFAMTITASGNSTLRRHCEAKEKIRGERKIHLPKQSHPSLNNERLLRR